MMPLERITKPVVEIVQSASFLILYHLITLSHTFQEEFAMAKSQMGTTSVENKQVL